jgi:hypothetical protein
MEGDARCLLRGWSSRVVMMVLQVEIGGMEIKRQITSLIIRFTHTPVNICYGVICPLSRYSATNL